MFFTIAGLRLQVDRCVHYMSCICILQFRCNLTAFMVHLEKQWPFLLPLKDYNMPDSGWKLSSFEWIWAVRGERGRLRQFVSRMPIAEPEAGINSNNKYVSPFPVVPCVGFAVRWRNRMRVQLHVCVHTV